MGAVRRGVLRCYSRMNCLELYKRKVGKINKAMPLLSFECSQYGKGGNATLATLKSEANSQDLSVASLQMETDR